MTKTVKLYAPAMQELKKSFPAVYAQKNRDHYLATFESYVKSGIPEKLAHELTITRGLFAAMDIIDVAQLFSIKISKSAETYFYIEEFLDLAWIRTQIIIHPTENHWEGLSREALRDDLDWQQRQLTAGIINFDTKHDTLVECVDSWAELHHTLIERWRQILVNLQSGSALNYTMFFVAIRELLDLTQTAIQVTNKSAE